MQIEKFTICRDSKLYLAWPDIAMGEDESLVCVFNECTHHCRRSHTRIMLCESNDRGRSWTARRPLTESTDGLDYYYNCPRIFRLGDGQLAIIIDRIPASGENGNGTSAAANVIYRSTDNGKNWSKPVSLPLCGIVPDKIHVLDTGRMLASAHRMHDGRLAQFLVYSDDQGKHWSREIMLAHSPQHDFCEGSLLPLGGGIVVAFLRENSRNGLDCFKTISHDNGETWGPVTEFPMPGCHRPVSGLLHDGRIFITYRFFQGGGKGMGDGSQNFFCAVTNRKSVLATTRNEAQVRIIPIDYDAAPKADLGYSGWVQFPSGELYIVNYIVDDWLERGQIRGYSIRLNHGATGSRCPCCTEKDIVCGTNPE